MPDERQPAKRRKVYQPPSVESEIIQDLSAGGCGKCPNAGVDSADCSWEPIQGTS